MKPNNIRIDTEVYNFANDGRTGELTLTIPSGAMADAEAGGSFADYVLDFAVGSPLAEYAAMIFSNKVSAWKPAISDSFEATMEQFYNGASQGTYQIPVLAQIYRLSGNRYRLFLSVTGLGGSAPVKFYLREEIVLKIRVKTFLQPLLDTRG